MNKNNSLKNKRIAMIATDGFEQSELLQPKQKLAALGAEVDVVSTITIKKFVVGMSISGAIKLKSINKLAT